MYICVLSAGTVLYKSCFRYLCWPVHLKSCAQWHTSPWIFIYIFCHGCDAFNESSIWISRIFFSSSECVVDGCRCQCCCCFCNNSNKKHLAVFYYITMNRRFHSPQIRFCYNDTRVEQQLMHPQIAITKSNLILCSLQHFFMPISFCT